ncbi:MAG: hypothetical protein M1826_004508 [Phylliscum demangeonii]|nr:MAG: hypothetical protein M1826_004508 [Phylliscum demangeonii]
MASSSRTPLRLSAAPAAAAAAAAATDDDDDDRTAAQHCIPFILERLSLHHRHHQHPHPHPQPHHATNPPQPPLFILGISGIQGIGKTTLVRNLATILRSPPHSLPLATLSLDDLYLRHSEQVALATAHPDNQLVQHRGQPGTHDLALGAAVFASLSGRQRPTRLPRYDKARYGGRGDRAPEESWPVVGNEGDGEVQLQLLIFEGWCVAFRALEPRVLEERWRRARRERCERRKAGAGAESEPESMLAMCSLEEVRWVNERLRGYDVFTNDTDRLQSVYRWRREAEAARRLSSTTTATATATAAATAADNSGGLSDAEVTAFVQGWRESLLSLL